MQPARPLVPLDSCFLVDSSGNVRWRGSGEASDAEVRSLWGAAQALESEEAGARRR